MPWCCWIALVPPDRNTGDPQVTSATLDTAIHTLAYAWGKPVTTGRMRGCPEDFQVTEIPLLEPDGGGEHVWLWIRKRGENTEYVAGLLSKLAGVHPRQISYAGMKDRHAVTEQCFSVQLAGKGEPCWEDLNTDTLTVLRHARHSRKLRRGALKGNIFKITLRDIDGDRDALEQRLAVIAREGVPNYFGEQRFGRDGSNLQTADRLFRNPGMRLSRHKRSLTLSAARSFLFNRVLSARVDAGNWNRPLPGDAMQLHGSHSFFVAENIDAELSGRLASQDIHPTGPLYGRGESQSKAACRALEADVLAGYTDWCAGLEAAGLRQDRRALRLGANELAWHWQAADVLVLTFSLPAGAYATSVLRELLQVNATGGG